jgi:arylsulfatase A-like enzyme
LVVVHLVKFRGAKLTIYFIFFCLLFGVLRAYAIHWIQITQNASFIPYEASRRLLTIGRDSPQVYVGWLLTIYISWTIAEFILEKLGSLRGKILPTVAVAFLLMCSFSYMIEVTASFTGWWHWNVFLTRIAQDNVFFNVPWVGVIDWGSVALDFLLPFLVIWTYGYKKISASLASLIFPAAHIASHLRVANFVIRFSDTASITFSQFYHFLMAVSPLIFVFFGLAAIIGVVRKKSENKEKLDRRLIFGALGVLAVLALVLDVRLARNWQFLISFIPILTFVLYSVRNIKFRRAIYFIVPILFITTIVHLDLLVKQRILISALPFFFLWCLEKKEEEAHRNYLGWLKLIGIWIIIYAFLFSSAWFFSSRVHLDSGQIKAGSAFNADQIILVTIDTIAADRVNYYGWRGNVTTPNLDQFAGQNTVFMNAYTPMPWTLTAHVSLMTGRMPSDHGIINNSQVYFKKSDILTLAQYFRDKGFKTAAFVATELFREGSAISQGFDTFDNSPEPGMAMPLETNSAQSVNTKVFKWLQQNKNEKFFLWVHYYDAHAPYIAPSPFGGRYTKAYSASKYSDPATQKSLYISPIMDYQNAKNYKKIDAEFLSAAYDEELLYVDSQFGNFINRLKDLNIYQGAAVIVAGDHGESFDHNYFEHGLRLYQSSIKVPLIVKYSDSVPHQAIQDNVSIMDIYQTLTGIMSDQPKDFQSCSLSDADGSRCRRDRRLIAQTASFPTPFDISGDPPHYGPRLGIIMGNFKYIFNQANQEEEIYDIALDPGETINLMSSDKVFFISEIAQIKSEQKELLGQ